MATKTELSISTYTSVLGPQSEPTKIDGRIKRTLYFYFGLPKTTDTKKQ
ncbi:MAG: hypothetical protein LH478_07075 [Chitinophagaceae bacterium]|nr:hypothetical protein [Chitinophagaceae bacterium]